MLNEGFDLVSTTHACLSHAAYTSLRCNVLQSLIDVEVLTIHCNSCAKYAVCIHCASTTLVEIIFELAIIACSYMYVSTAIEAVFTDEGGGGEAG